MRFDGAAWRSTTRSRPVAEDLGHGARRFVNRTAVVTGAGQGIGRATALRLGAEGANVLVADKNVAGAERVVAELRATSVEAHAAHHDVSTPEGAGTVLKTALGHFQRVDVLVNCVGGSRYGPKLAWEYTVDEIRANIDANLWTTLWCCWTFLPHMIERGSGAIVNVGSNSPRGTMRFPYAAAKGGVFAITTSLGLETAKLGVRVNAIAPHWTVSGDKLIDRLGRSVEPGASGVSEATAQRHLGNIPMGRAGRAEEQAAAIAFLASDDASFITAQVLSVGGGASV
jgi:NAD(P)-dependent dehydrogenase (short-subunit alcohol dehydrogenase family)